MCAERGFGGLAQADLALCVGVFFLQALDVVGLPEGLGAEGAEGGGEGLAVLGIALWGSVTGQRQKMDKRKKILTSRLKIRSLTTAMTRVMVSVTSPSLWPGWAKSMLLPSRRRPRDNSWLLMYNDAVRRFSDSIIADDVWSSYQFFAGSGFVCCQQEPHKRQCWTECLE
jgi:hypothetical protein